MTDAPEKFLQDRVTLLSGDCLSLLPMLTENSIDACVCDPPYHLTSIVKRFGAENSAPCKVGKTGAYARASAGFMGKVWDGGDIAFRPETWAAVYRVLKPGGHLIAFGGTRTYHRMACAIEDAGFEVRDCCSWNFGSGFPKSHNISKVLDAKKERCTCPTDLRGLQDDLDTTDTLSGGAEQDVFPKMCGDLDRPQKSRSFSPDGNAQGKTASDVCCVREDVLAERQISGQESEAGLFAQMQRGVSRDGLGETRAQGRGGAQDVHTDVWPEKPGMEGRGDLPESPRELCEREIYPLSDRSDLDGADGRLCNGASGGDGSMDRATIDPGGMCSPHRSPAIEQCADKLGIVALQPQPQKRGTWDRCGRCGKPIVPDGLGTALKPAMELICLARKPLSESTVAANVLKWGTGALNIDGCRVATDEQSDRAGGRRPSTHEGYQRPGATMFQDKTDWELPAKGRWPANVILSDDPEVRAAFPDAPGQQQAARDDQRTQGSVYGKISRNGTREHIPRGDSGSAARFFYQAEKDTLCDLCGLPYNSSCNVSNAESSSPTGSTPTGVSVRSDVADSPSHDSAGKPHQSSGHANNAESYSQQCLQREAVSAQVNVPRWPLEKIVQNVSDAANLCNLCATDIAHALAEVRRTGIAVHVHFNPSIGSFKETILFRSLASYVASRENTDTILTTMNLKELFGCVFAAIAENTNSEKAGNEANTKPAPKRLFYSSKADGDDRLGSKHPTVKPLDLMQYLVRLVTPPKGVVLDCFAGTGTTGEAAWREGFNAVLIEREEEYQSDIRRRMALCMSGAGERERESIKAKTKDKPVNHGPLFGGRD
jgi:DNA modification methylase